MATFARSVSVDWAGTLMEGKGQVKAGTGAFAVPVTFPARLGEPAGMTTPEELMAASHAVCYAMGLAANLGRNGGSARNLNVTATVTADKGEGGIKLQSSALKAVAEGLQGVDAAKFAEIAQASEKGCPISNAIRGSMQITVEASAK
jgi:osmotically inducible protein OsmC